jgi:fido (protein-threonine AMPylation protein)
MTSEFGPYYEAAEPGKRERAHAWATAIGLQDVDSLKPSAYLIETAKRHIEGEISQEDARRLVDEYYETKEGHDLPGNAEEADKVSARMVAIINSPTFNFSVPYYLGLHRQIFGGVFPFAGEVRTVELTKREWVLDGDTVLYTPSCMIRDTLEYDFGRERKFKYKGLGEDAFVAHFAAFISGIWQIHPFREGNTRTTALFAIKYLRSRGCRATNDLFAEKSYYFRNALVRANYANDKRGIEPTLRPLEEFFRVLVFGHGMELRNRFLRIGQERESATGGAIGNLHRRKGGGDVAANVAVNVVANDAARLNASERKAMELLRKDPHLTAARLAGKLDLTPRQGQRIVAALKKKAGLERRGADKNGEWHFPASSES